MPTVILNFPSQPGRAEPAPVATKRIPLVGGASNVRARIPATTNLDALDGKRALCVVDADNLDFSLKRHGLRLQYEKLLNRLIVETKDIFSVAVLCSPPGETRRVHHLEACGWRVVSIPWEKVTTFQGERLLANADMDLAFEAGSLSNIGGCDAVLIGTGDGDLAVSIARGLRRIHGRTSIAIHTMSVLGASSSRLRHRTDLFDSSVIIGEDMLENVNGWHEDSARYKF